MPVIVTLCVVGWFYSSNQMHGFSGNSCTNYDSQLSLGKIHLKSACLQ